jgi:hypothetical protein
MLTFRYSLIFLRSAADRPSTYPVEPTAPFSSSPKNQLVCRDCGRTIEVEGPAIERWTDRIAAEHGFSDVQHHLEIFGRCNNCAAQTQLSRSPCRPRAERSPIVGA